MTELTASVRDQIQSLLAKAEDGSMVQAIRGLFKVLKDNSLMYQLRIKSSLIGVHEDNRDGYGVNPWDVHTLLSDIFDVGFDESEIKCVCIEIDHQSTATVDFNRSLVAQSGGLLAPVESLKFASLCGSHTNQCLRALSASIQHGNDAMCIDGRLSLEKVRSKDKAFAVAAECGLVWWVLNAS